MRQAVHEKQSYYETSLRVLSGQLVMGLHGRNSHPLDCQLRSQTKVKCSQNPPLKGGASNGNGGSKEGQGAASKHAIVDNQPNRGSTAPSFIGGLQPSIVRSQSATY